MLWYCFFSLIFCFVSVATKQDIDWLHCAVLDDEGKYRVCWATSVSNEGHSEIVFGVDVQAHGYVGFGLSPKGGMAGSDIVTGWVRDGQAYFQDRHGIGNTFPVLDASADWHLLHGSENDTHTSLVFRRKLDTCDKEDIKIDDSTTKLIYAYTDVDPLSENDLQYHQGRRGSKSVLLLQPRKKGQQIMDKSQLLHWDVLSPNFKLTSFHSTMYWCKIYKAPAVAVQHHIVLVEPLIQKGNEGYVHHLLLYECVGANPEEYDPHLDKVGHQCHRPNMPDAMKRCEGVSLAWGVGGEELVLPDNVGLPIESSHSKYYMLEIHYDNPFRHNDIVDSSGFRIYYTPNLRQFDAGTIMIGSTISPRAFIPPKVQEYVVAGHSNPLCLDPVLPENGIKILGVFMHSHLLGRRLKARHFRNKTELPPFATDNNYDFNYQEYRYYSEEVDFLPGDQVTMECTYDASGRNATTFGGESTQEEMCLVFLLYYPRVERFASLSVAKINEINSVLGGNLNKGDVNNGQLYRFLLNYDWTSVDIKNVENTLRYSKHDSHCYLGNGDKNSVKQSISYPENFQPYEERLSCSSKEFQKDVHSGSRNTYFGRSPIENKLIILFITLFYIFHVFTLMH